LSSRLIKALGDDLARAVRSEVPLALKLVGVFASPTDSLDQVERADGLSVDCTVEGVPGALITVAVQAAALEAASREDDTPEPQAGDPRMVQIVQEVPVEVVAELGRLTMGLRSVLKLQKGQVLRLSTAVDDPVRVEVAGLKKFTGVPVVSRGQLAVEIRNRYGD
jgi:flagellar motor switch/type III secretory pathway protein FliN